MLESKTREGQSSPNQTHLCSGYLREVKMSEVNKCTERNNSRGVSRLLHRMDDTIMHISQWKRQQKRKKNNEAFIYTQYSYNVTRQAETWCLPAAWKRVCCDSQFLHLQSLQANLSNQQRTFTANTHTNTLIQINQLTAQNEKRWTVQASLLAFKDEQPNIFTRIHRASLQLLI